MNPARQIPVFAVAPWYFDPRDHRCPHDAWLEAVEIREPAEGSRNENRRTVIVVRLLGPYHDGYITFRYSGVKKFRLGSDSCRRGLGDWLEDLISVTADGTLRHDITWCFGPDIKSAWFIEAEDISYEWNPNNT